MSSIIAIAGGSCSGKTTLARYLQAHLGESRCMLIRQDDYYHDIRDRAEGDEIPNFDVPEALDFAQLGSDLASLKRGEAVCLPNYDFATHQRRLPSEAQSPRPFTIVEGILLLCAPEVRAISDHKVFMACDKKLRFERRLSRDVAERERTEEFVRHQFSTEVEPAHQKYVEPSAGYADLVIQQDDYLNNLNDVIDRITARLPEA